MFKSSVSGLKTLILIILSIALIASLICLFSVSRSNRLLREEVERLSSPPKGFYQKLATGRDVSILVVGDSIGAGAGSTDGNSWTELLENWIEQTYYCRCDIANISLGGNTSYAGYVSVMRLDNEASYDLAVICYGENDDTGGFTKEYEAIIRALRLKYPQCALISILESSQKTYTEKIGDIKALADHYGYPVADMIAAFDNSGRSFDELCADDKHPNDEGYRLYFETLSSIISSKCDSFDEYSCTETDPLDPGVKEYDKFYYIPAENCIRTDDNTWTIDFNGSLTGKLGMDHELTGGGSSIGIIADNAPVTTVDFEWDDEKPLKTIHKIYDNDCTVTMGMKLSFTSKEMADAFHGLIFTGG
ncbi:MAG: SGNH/GDSL hydrolase family protein [Lachnospiraceae bacterium]|nr:SGNH/GDSL hydrolase family protein [Lachnospiraceae bacterium]